MLSEIGSEAGALIITDSVSVTQSREIRRCPCSSGVHLSLTFGGEVIQLESYYINATMQKRMYIWQMHRVNDRIGHDKECKYV